MDIYSTLRWRATRARALRRDEFRCTVSRFLGGSCSSGPLHAHHIQPISDGGDPYDLDNVGTTCSRHHPQWERLRRLLVKPRELARPRCTHQHRTREAREICERRLARQHAQAA